MDNRVRNRVKHLVNMGVRRLPEMRRHLESFVENELFPKESVPPKTDSRYWPSSRAILNCIYQTVVQLR